MKDIWSSGYNGEDIIKIHRADNAVKYFTVDWMLHDRCTYDCSYCPPANKSGTDSWLDLVILDRFCDGLEAHVARVDPGAKIRVIFTGGEPTVWKDFGKLIDRLIERGWALSMSTNASRSARWWKENAKKFVNVNLSYHTEGVVDDEFIEKVLICEQQIDTSVNIMLNTNPIYFEKSINFGRRVQQETKFVAITHYQIQHTFGLQKINVPFYTTEQKEIIKTLQDYYPLSGNRYQVIMNDYRIKTIDDKELELRAAELFTHKKANFKDWSCYVGLESVFIDARGDIIRGTCRVGDIMGNILDPENINWVTEPIVCPLMWCSCVTDIRNTKIKNI